MKIRLAFLLLMLAASSLARAVDVRGRIDFVAYQGVFPMVQASVQLCHPNAGCTPPYITGQDGMFYLAVGPGPHDLLVNGRVVGRVNIPNWRAFDVPPHRGN